MPSEISSTGHPDAGLLSAFAENALSDSERVELLGHLQGCTRCRDVLFLAQQALPEEASAPVAMSSPRRGWFKFRWLSLGGVVAGALALVLVTVHRADKPALGSTAGLVKPEITPSVSTDAIPQQEVSELAPPMMERKTKISAAPNVAAPKAAAPAAVLAKQPEPVTAMEAPPPMAAPLPTMQRDTTWADAPAPVTSAQVARAQRAFTAHDQKVAQSTEASAPMKKDALSMAASAAPLPSNGAAMGGPPPPAYAASANQTVEAQANSAAALDVSPAGSSAVSGYLAAPAVKSKMRAGLSPSVGYGVPSGMRVVSSVVVRGRTFALDSAGRLFASDSLRQSWQEVKGPWTGKITNLRRSPSGDGVVEISVGLQRWTSSDGGKSWHEVVNEK